MKDSIPNRRPQHIKSAQPYRQSALTYIEKGWQYPLPLPAHKKSAPPDGTFGWSRPYPTHDMISGWLADDSRKNANIGLRLPPGVVGIDVDENDDNGLHKNGLEELATLTQRYGPLPPTWRSSARDNASGIRFYRVPERRLQYKGKIAKYIDIICTGIRYAVVYPSYHPTGGMYTWYDPDGNPMDEPPSVEDLPELPQEWLDYATDNQTPYEDRPYDETSTDKDIRDWARGHLPKAEEGTWLESNGKCTLMDKYLSTALKNQEGTFNVHDTARDAHWSILNAAVEGHYGWQAAVNEYNNFVVKQIADGKADDRSVDSLKGEFARLIFGALRKIKAAHENESKPISNGCGCVSAEGLAENLAKKLSGADLAAVLKGKSPGEYDQNDDGNAEHFLDLFPNNVHYVPEWKKWAVWDEDELLWKTDDGAAIRSFMLVKFRQIEFARTLYERRDELYRSFLNDGLTPAEIRKEQEYKDAAAAAREWEKWAVNSGNVRQVTNALDKASTFKPEIIRAARDFDCDESLLGVSNGVMVLSSEGVSFRERTREDFITMSVPHPYLDLEEQRNSSNPAIANGVVMLEDYLDKFIPDLELRNHLQMVLGYGLLGINPLRIAVFIQSHRTGTGKSTIAKLISAAMGKKEYNGYAASINASLFREKELNAQLADVLDSRFVITSELSEDNFLHADVFKRLVSVDEISAEKKYANEQIRRNAAFLPIIATNGAPTIKGADAAVQFRMYVVPFDEQIGSRDDPLYPVRLEREAGMAMFAWLVEGYKRYAADPTAVVSRDRWPEAVRVRKSEFHGHLSEINEFMAEALIKKEEASVSCSDVWDRWVDWCFENNVKNEFSRNKFGRKITNNGIEKKLGRFDSGSKPEWRYLNVKMRRGGTARTGMPQSLRPVEDGDS